MCFCVCIYKNIAAATKKPVVEVKEKIAIAFQENNVLGKNSSTELSNYP